MIGLVQVQPKSSAMKAAAFTRSFVCDDRGSSTAAADCTNQSLDALALSALDPLLSATAGARR
eukprot:2889489-Pleurochrysis_carterae.AAC.4